ncbi:MAG TPA: FKBP-type peptidyl-prolyl cis-trans isomerase [Nocardioides sp.]|uniref:FKBP-type peptidyl-prolyl cis-trans isomerase n=1 Tax=Nocardioides sp. TaxID=35761 RepID=UPI002E344A0F|nr:FKBP-type peptidyl-prolyl cis-trans isomerase [Nocardioides sp.]HEX3931639.1 FKBP-type peptidyl-prolyl cis-trans isomerase [Nocardioides sp.]
MHTRSQLRLLSAALVAAAVMLAGCGSSNSSTPSADSSTASGSPSGSPTATPTGDGSKAFDDVKVSGAVGTGATVTFTQGVSGVADATKVLAVGKGDKVSTGDSLIVQTVIADATTKTTAASSYADKQPQVVSLTSQVQALFLNALKDKSVGSRVGVVAPAAEIFGPSGNANLKIAASDTVFIIFDIIGKPLDKPDGKKLAAPSWFPAIKSTKGVISGLDFAKTPKPDGKLRSAVVSDGTGPVVKKGQTIFARYLGEVYQGTKPFDQNFSGTNAATPASFQIGTGHVIPGWDKTLVGKHVGSEVLLAIPPVDGYGKKGQPQAGIKGTDTLYFVVDIVGAA